MKKIHNMFSPARHGDFRAQLSSSVPFSFCSWCSHSVSIQEENLNFQKMAVNLTSTPPLTSRPGSGYQLSNKVLFLPKDEVDSETPSWIEFRHLSSTSQILQNIGNGCKQTNKLPERISRRARWLMVLLLWRRRSLPHAHAHVNGREVTLAWVLTSMHPSGRTKQ